MNETLTQFDYKQAATAALKQLKRDRDRQIIARRFGFGLAKKQTLEKIGRDFSITRERVRQIEKATLAKLRGATTKEVTAANAAFKSFLETHGQVASLDAVAEAFGAEIPQGSAYLLFLAELAADIAVIDAGDQFRAALALLPEFSTTRVAEVASGLVATITEIGKPQPLNKIAPKLSYEIAPDTLAGIAGITKALSSLDGKWGLVSWPEVNPRSIRDKTYLVLVKQNRPLHFSEIARRIHELKPGSRVVTIQAVHNELIKDLRFVLIGRGIYALSEWGYTPGTVADIIVEVLRDEAPLHKDEIVKRVLGKRQVKTTTIVLNLQEKPQFVRVAKATYTLKDS